MRAIVVDEAGPAGALRVADIADPMPGLGQVRVAVEVAAVTFVDTLIRAGSTVAPPARFPLIPGNGVAGAIDRVGPDVDSAWSGATVVTATGGRGGYATLALAAAADVHRVPGGLGLREAAALLADGRTALGLHEAAETRAGETVVITAAAGGVGGLLVQLANAAGARVIGLAGSDAKLAHARDLGAHEAVNYREAGWSERLRHLAPRGVDVVFDGVGAPHTNSLVGLVRSGGRYVQHGAAGGSWAGIGAAAAERDIAVIPLSAIGATPEALYDLTERALALGAAGALRPTIGQTFPLEQAAAAHEAIEARRTIGKTLLLT